jgi:ABC-type lipoprotein release transport system permease subunit
MGGISLWVRAEWRRRWPVLVALAVLVSLAGGVATALYAGAKRADTALVRFREQTAPYNLEAWVNLGAEKPASVAELERLLEAQRAAIADVAGLDGVESVRVESWWGISAFPDYDEPGTVSAFATGTSATYGTRYAPIVLEGALPLQDDPDAVVVGEHATDVLGWKVGDRLTFGTVSPDGLFDWFSNDATFGSRDALDGPVIEVEVVAVIRDEADLADDRFPSILFPEGFARAHRDEIAHVEPTVMIRADPNRIDDVADRIEAILGPVAMQVEELPPLGYAGASVAPTVAVEVTTLWIATAVAMTAGLFVVAQAVGRQLAAGAAEDRTRAALGVTTAGQAAGKWLTLLPVALIGAAGVPIVAWSLSGLFPNGLARRAEPDPGLRFDVSAVLGGAAMTLAVTLILTAATAWIGSRRRRRSTAPRVAPWPRLFASPAASLGASFAADPAGTGRSRAGSLATVAAIALGVAAVLAVTTLDWSRAHLTSSPRLYGAAAELVNESNGMFGVEETVERTVATAGVEAVSTQLMINDDTMPATGTLRAEVEPEAFETILGGARPPVSDGRHPEGPDEVALGVATAEDLGVGIGDEVAIAAFDGSATLTLRVTGTVVTWGDDDTTHGFIVTVPTLHSLICPGAAPDDCNLSADVFADVTDDAAGAAARTTLLEHGFERVFPPGSVDRLREVGAIPAYLAGFLCVLAAAAMLHQLAITLRRRGLDLAVVRALGLPARRAASALTWQAMLTNIAGVTLGALAGAIAGPLVWRIIAESLGVQTMTRFPVVVIPIAALVGAAVAVLVSFGPRLRAARLPLAETLRVE